MLSSSKIEEVSEELLDDEEAVALAALAMDA